MLCQSYDIVAQHASLRWKEWIPLISQQLRLRNLIQIIAFRVNPSTEDLPNSSQIIKKHAKVSFYYTLHLTTMSAPFYTSEKLENDNPKWSEIELTCLINHVNASINGIVVRLWLHREKEPDHVIIVWGVYFNGLVYLGPKLCPDPLAFHSNTIVFHMQGGYFTAAQCLIEEPIKSRVAKVDLSPTDIKPSYKVGTLSNLHRKQQIIKKNLSAIEELREKISVGGFTTRSHENAVLRRLLHESRPKVPKRQEVLKARQEVELIKFRVEMLAREKIRKQTELQQRERIRSNLNESNLDRGLELMSKYQNLHKDIERLKEWKKGYLESREALVHTNAHLSFRRKQLISELSLIYPIEKVSDARFTICGVFLPNSDVFNGNEEVMLSVALGFVAHLVQMVSVFLQVSPRYAISHFSSRSKIIDHVTDKIPDKNREFPLFLRSKDKLQFNYGVYLLNKNIAQLRWYCGIATRDLPATLPNISALLLSRSAANGLDFTQLVSGSSLDLRSSSQNVSPVGSLQTTVLRRHTSGNKYFERGHRVTRSVGNSDSELKVSELDVASISEEPDVGIIGNSLSYSLDKGLDEYKDIKKAEVKTGPEMGVARQQLVLASLVGSEPILTPEMHDKMRVLDVRDAATERDEAQKRFLQNWEARGGPGLCSDDDYEVKTGRDLQDQAFKADRDEAFQAVGDQAFKADRDEAFKAVSDQAFKADHDEAFQAVGDKAFKADRDEVFNAVGEQGFKAVVVKGFKPVSDKAFTSEHDLDYKSKRQEASTSAHEAAVSCIDSITDNLSCSDSEVLSDAISEVTQLDVSQQDSQETSDEMGLPNVSAASEGQTMLDDVSKMMVEDNQLASVASRTEALANRKTSFNRVRSRNSSSLEDGLS